MTKEIIFFFTEKYSSILVFPTLTIIESKKHVHRNVISIFYILHQFVLFCFCIESGQRSQLLTMLSRERERQRDRETERDRETQRERDRERQRDTTRGTHRYTQRDTYTQSGTHRVTHTE